MLPGDGCNVSSQCCVVHAMLLAVNTGNALGQPQRVQQHSTDGMALPDDLNEHHGK